MQQRVALARALAIEPRVLLLDEPLSALDAKVRVQLREEIRRIQLDLGITTLYVTHDQEEALAISDHVAVMYGGVIEQMGPPSEMYTAPATPFVAEFIGTMNRLEARIVDATSGEVEHAGLRFRRRRCAWPHGRRAGAGPGPPRVARGLGGGGNGADEQNALRADVITHTFLGPVTRVKLAAGELSLTADMPPARAAALPVGSSVIARVPGEGLKLLELAEDAPASLGLDPEDH